MAIRRRCNGRTCKKGRRCLDHLWFDVMYRGQRYRMTVNEFAVPRMEVGKQRPIESMEEARNWERLFIGEVKAGRDPRRPRTPRKATDVAPKDVASFLDSYVERCVKPAGLKSEKSLISRVGVLKTHLGELPLERARRRRRHQPFQTDLGLRRGGRGSNATRARNASSRDELGHGADAAVLQEITVPPLRCADEQEGGDDAGSAAAARRGEAAPRRRAAEDEHVGASVRRTAAPRPHHRRAGAVQPARRNAADPEQARELGDVPDRHPRPTAKDKENRRIPFNPDGRVAAILERRAKLGPDAYVFGSAKGSYQPELQTAWETLRLLAHGIEPRPTRKGAAWNREQLQRIDLRWHDLRHEGACRLLADGVDIRIIQLMLGHASIQQTQRYLNVTDEELRRGLEVSWNNKGRPLRLAAGA